MTSEHEHAPELAALTAEERRAMCMHEAAHAVLHALGGAFVYGVAVAPVGAVDWRTPARKGGELSDLWGVCRVSDAPCGWFLRWDTETGFFSGDVRGYRQLLAFMEEKTTGARAEQLRQLRAWVVGAMAGPVADGILAGREPDFEPCGFGTVDDAALIEALCWFLPAPEKEHLQALTLHALRDRQVWAHVERLAAELELTGEVEDLAVFLPQPSPDWPPSARMRRPMPLVVKPHPMLPATAAAAAETPGTGGKSGAARRRRGSAKSAA